MPNPYHLLLGVDCGALTPTPTTSATSTTAPTPRLPLALSRSLSLWERVGVRAPQSTPRRKRPRKTTTPGNHRPASIPDPSFSPSESRAPGPAVQISTAP